jgi:hypothetical protein
MMAPSLCKPVPEYLSDSELERIEEFAKKPAYEREPEQLLPRPATED